jgi:putative transposase
LGRQYVRLINGRYRRTGTLWEGRFKACVVDTESYLLRCYRYIELNPVRARMVPSPGEYRWSSYHANALGQADYVVTPHPEYRRLGATDEERLQAYRALFAAELELRTVVEISNALNQELAFGSEHFKDQIEVMARRRVRPGQPGRPRKEAS